MPHRWTCEEEEQGSNFGVQKARPLVLWGAREVWEMETVEEITFGKVITCKGKLLFSHLNTSLGVLQSFIVQLNFDGAIRTD